MTRDLDPGVIGLVQVKNSSPRLTVGQQVTNSRLEVNVKLKHPENYDQFLACAAALEQEWRREVCWGGEGGRVVLETRRRFPTCL